MNWNQRQRNIKKQVEKAGFRYLADKPVSPHPDDKHIRVVLGYREWDNSYATWKYNAEIDGLFHGRYDLDKERAHDEFLVRV